MKLLILITALLFSFALPAQETIRKKKKGQTEARARKKPAKPVSRKNEKAGKAVPNEKGSGMTVPDADQPKLDTRPNPAQTVPSTRNPADGSPRP